MKIQNKRLVDLSGAIIKSGDVELTVAAVLVNCALMPADGGKGYSSSITATRYDTAIQLNRLVVDESIELSIDVISMLLNDVLRAYTPIIAGQVQIALNGTH